jgi:hypothetical protein
MIPTRLPAVTSDGLAAGVLFVVVAVLACLSPIQSDTWWLLRAGQEIWATGSVPMADTYTHTAAGRYWWNHEWLTEAIFYAVFRAGGPALLTLLAAGAIFATWFTCWRMTRGPFELRFALFAICVPVSAASWAVRPQAFSMLLFVALCHALTVERLWKWIPLGVLVWINLHGAGVVALVVVAGALVAETLRTRRLPVALTAVLAASFVATGLSPVGFRMYAEIAASVERSRINQLIEWLPPDASPWNWPFWALAVALPISLVARNQIGTRFGWKTSPDLDVRTLRLAGIALAVLPLAARSTRNVHLFLLAALPALTSAWHYLARERSRRGERVHVNGGILSAASLAAAALVGILWLNPPPRLGWRPISFEATEAINACNRPIYNTYGDGGILIWFTPGVPVFIDNRQDPFPTELLRANRQLELDGNFGPLFEQYGIRCAALAPGSVVAGKLATAPGWAEIYSDPAWVVFSR